MPSSRIQNDFELFSHLIFTDLGRNSNNSDERSHQMADEPMPMVNGELERQDQETDERQVSSQIFYWSDRELGHGNSTVYEGEFTKSSNVPSTSTQISVESNSASSGKRLNYT